MFNAKKLPFACLGLVILAIGLQSANAATCNAEPLSGDHVIEFPLLSPQNSPQQATGTIRITCNDLPLTTTSVDFTVSLSAGLSNDFSQRELRNGNGNAVLYNIYNDTNQSAIVGNGEIGTDTTTLPASCIAALGSCATLLNVYGVAEITTLVPAGTYQDDYIISLFVDF